MMGELGFPNFALVAVDQEGVPAVLYRSNSPAGDRAVRAFMEDWLDQQAALHEVGLPDHE